MSGGIAEALDPLDGHRTRQRDVFVLDRLAGADQRHDHTLRDLLEAQSVTSRPVVSSRQLAIDAVRGLLFQ